MTTKTRIYLASPLGFAESTRGFMVDLIADLATVVTVVNPWDDTTYGPAMQAAHALTDITARKAAFHAANLGIGAKNERMIRSVDRLVAVLDGIDVDSGTAGEMGFAYGLGKPVYGLRTDWRMTGDNEAAGVNLQLRYFIEESGGSYHTSISSLIAALGQG
ncbi:MAG TPA: nucleoside 2-deoxyribosyltransferase [Thermomicrobiales bacterium]|nr:nucleoside 2-deoxyribosyltransferase [Thermomicrobiales bacterium]